MTPAVLTVSQINRFIKSLIEGDGRLRDIYVTGEISNFTDHYRSGHLYFSLKDESSLIKAVMFASAAKNLRFRPGDGMKVIARGRISLYEPSGQYQLYVTQMQPDGIGALSLAYEQLKKKLEGEGLFDPSCKKKIPPYPSSIGVITSPTGAAVRDILQITARRWPMARIVFYPVLVQGEGAPAQLKQAVEEMDRSNCCDVIILGRGGGSLEDLWAFNSEELARAVYRASTPIVSAVGHETDFTICDFVADLRAPTPSAAAELCTPDMQEELGRLLAFRQYFSEKSEQHLEALRQSLDHLLEHSPLESPQKWIEPYKQALSQLQTSLSKNAADVILKQKSQLSVLAGKLDTLSPLHVLARGYSVVKDSNGNTISRISQVKSGEKITIQVADGQFGAVTTHEEV